MREYGIVSPQFWIGATGKALRGHPEAQVLALYLMTCPHANMIGVFHCPVLYMAHETGLGMEGASKGLRRLIEADFCRYDEATEEVFVVRMAAYQIGEALDPKDKRCIGIAKELDKVSSDQLRIGFSAIFSIAFNLPTARQKAAQKASPFEAPSKPLRSQEQDQEQEQEQDQDQDQEQEKVKRPVAAAPPRLPDLPDFVDRELWDAWVQGRKGKKITAVAAGLAIGQLAEWHHAGLDANAALRKAAIGGHQGLFEPSRTAGHSARDSPPTETAYQASQRRKVDILTGRNRPKTVVIEAEIATVEYAK
jgi:hypothetical protein